MLKENQKGWIKKLGIAGFLFFLIKGLVWLFAGGAIINWMCNN